MTLRTHKTADFSKRSYDLPRCPSCKSADVIRIADDTMTWAAFRYQCMSCQEKFNAPLQNLTRRYS